jgi:membrane associated rhomboid family serine protease
VTPVVRALIAINVVVFFLQQTVQGITQTFLFVPFYVLQRPWTALTYMFLHGGLGHIFFNMLALFFFGPRVEARIGSRPFLTMYLVAGLFGAGLSAILAAGAPILGASAGVFGVSLAFAYFYPTEQILIWGIIPIQARLLVILTGLFALFAGFTGAQGGIAHFAHLGGYLGAFLYLKWLDRRRTAYKRRVEKPSPEITKRLTAYQNIDKSRIHELNREEVDRILDKISAKGIGSLTAQEQLFLSNFVPPDDRKPM